MRERTIASGSSRSVPDVTCTMFPFVPRLQRCQPTAQRTRFPNAHSRNRRVPLFIAADATTDLIPSLRMQDAKTKTLSTSLAWMDLLTDAFGIDNEADILTGHGYLRWKNYGDDLHDL